MLIGVRPHGKKIVLNPGPKYILRGEDTCYFFSITGEEETNIIDEASGGVPAGAGGRSTRATEGGKSSDTRKNLSLIKEMQRS